MSWKMGLSIGESFMEVVAKNAVEGQPPLSQLFYLGSEAISTSIKKFLSQNSIEKVDEVYISSRRLFKILDKKMGSSVACLFTAGFEKWAWIRQPPTKSQFEMAPERFKFPSSEDLIFGVTERVHQNGEIEIALQTSEIEFLISKLKMMDVKRVCINFLHSHKNSTHLLQAQQILQQAGFEVFNGQTTPTHWDEVQIWRRNIINAGLAGTARELKEELKLALGESKIIFISSEEKLRDIEIEDYISEFWAGSLSLREKHLTDGKNLLHLGLENFFFFNQKSFENSWMSPWGPVEIKLPQGMRFRTLPTLNIELNTFNEISLGQRDEGYEPGPMSWGRSQKMMAFDVLAHKLELQDVEPLSTLWNKTGHQRFVDSVHTLIRHSKSGENPESLLNRLFDDFMQRLCIEIQMNSSQNQIVVGGYFAKHLTPHLKKLLPNYKFELLEQGPVQTALASLEYGIQLSKLSGTKDQGGPHVS